MAEEQEDDEENKEEEGGKEGGKEEDFMGRLDQDMLARKKLGSGACLGKASSKKEVEFYLTQYQCRAE